MKIFLKVLKGLMYIGAAVCFVFFAINLIGGIYNACVADDLITAQDRTKASYNFIRMIIFIFATGLLLFLTLLIKEKIFPLVEKKTQPVDEPQTEQEEPQEEISLEEVPQVEEQGEVEE